MLNFGTRQNHILHLSWLAFFFSFVAWFNMAPFNTTLIRTVGLSQEQINILMLCNVALTIPARILIGIWVDYFGPRKVFSCLLLFSTGVCFYFASGKSFEQFLDFWPVGWKVPYEHSLEIQEVLPYYRALLIAGAK